MPLYFAYGANMDRSAMAVRCPASRPLGVATLPGWRLAVMREGWLTVTPDPQAHTQGVLWELAEADVAALDAFEDVGGGLYSKHTLKIIAESETTAMVYVGANAGPGVAKADYLAAVMAAARGWGLSADALAALTPSPP
jgi:gamma-glutamylcyclotransferase (GGCT)/AIG2-like uncharacterized protein YtfP